MATELRKTGIAAVGDMPWGTHFCHFYQTEQDLFDIMVPYLKAGLENNEFCLWVTAEPLDDETRNPLRRAIADVDRYLAAGDIEIHSYTQWYLKKDGTFDPQRVIEGWNTKLAQALAKGYAGLRVAADEAWLGKKYWKAFSEYEKQLDEPFAKKPVIVLCAYPLAASDGGAIFDVAHTHQFAIAARNGNWQALETPELRQAKAELERLNEELEQRVAERTKKLEAINEALKQENIQRQQAEQAMLQAQKLESLGVLAGGIAHDFNNLLVGILGNASLASMELGPESPARQTIQEIQLAGERAAELAKQMLAYSGKGRFVIEPLNLNALVEEMGHLLHASISKNVMINYDFARDLPPIEADATQIRQVIMNLVVNASEAIGNSNGVIAIRTGVTQVDGNGTSTDGILDPLAPAGDYVLCEIIDTGSGMDQETQARIFDPFFTTKFTGRGLGLAAVLGIVRGHHGGIKVFSEPGKGTSFRILFPAVPATKERSDMANQGTTQTPRRFSFTGKVLVIDDDDTVRSVTARLLKSFGVSVILAHDGISGLKLFEQHAAAIGCVLLDLTMPKPSGEEVFREIRRLDQNVPIIIMSGYNEEDAADRFTGNQITGFLHKPYTPEQLEQQLFKAFPKE